MSQTVKIKGIRDGLLITLGDGDWHAVQSALLEQLQERADFLRGARVTLEVGNHVLHAAEMGRLRDELSDFGVVLNAVISNSQVTKRTAQTFGLATRLSKPHPNRVARPLETPIPSEAGILVRKTLRSGFELQYPGHVTIVGDVNPGAKVVAGGSVVVWGRLRGVVHAGAEGDESAFVCALDLSPTQLRIAGEIAIPPKRKGKPQPEKAHLKEKQVVAEPWNFKN